MERFWIFIDINYLHYFYFDKLKPQVFLGNNNGGGGGGGGGSSGGGGCGGGNRPNHNFGGQDFLVGWSQFTMLLLLSVLLILDILNFLLVTVWDTRSLSSLSFLLICNIFMILILTRSRGGSGATRSHRAAAPASVEQTECGSKMSYGWCHRFHGDDVTDLKISRGWCHRFQRFQWCPNFQGRCHIFHRCQIDYVTDFKIQRCLKDDL